MNADLHALLDSLTDGENVKATWSHDQRTVTVEGPVYIIRREVWCDRSVRREDGEINSTLTSIEVVRDEEVTVTRDDEAALCAAIDALSKGDMATAEWRDGDRVTVATGSIGRGAAGVWIVHAAGHCLLRFADGELHINLRSLTVAREATVRWEREAER